MLLVADKLYKKTNPGESKIPGGNFSLFLQKRLRCTSESGHAGGLEMGLFHTVHHCLKCFGMVHG